MGCNKVVSSVPVPEAVLDEHVRHKCRRDDARQHHDGARDDGYNHYGATAPRPLAAARRRCEGGLFRF